MITKANVTPDIRSSDDRAQYDAACKSLLSEKILLAWILKDCVEEFRDIDVQEIAEKYIEGDPQVSEVPVMPEERSPSRITGMATEDSSTGEGTITYDIRFYALVPKSGELIRIIVNIEAQNDFYPGYPLIKRGIYYCSRMISSQYETEFTKSHYEDIRKVYSIWICANPPKYRQNSITRYRIREENLVGQVKERESYYDLMTVTMICLGNPDDRSDSEVLRLLDVLLSEEFGTEEKRKVLREEFDIPMTQPLEGKVNYMCNLSEGVYARGIEKGRQQGIEQGRQQGIDQTIVESIHSLMDTMKWTAQQAMDALKIPEDKQDMYAQLAK